ncbi:sulfurtransferase [Piscinibacter sp. Jin2]|uniref:Sulfurtransferase n=1 Tax=Aquariibacter lacus TaxID=2801332 RepID=A0A9X0XE48_9BURK|nr:sulfurtransferase [Piscinibacter lacus]MBL0719871.1 sulfurtransferase [Piscinibacter lacus]
MPDAPAPPDAVLNLAAYRFVPLDGLPALQAAIRAAAEAAGLRGTVLLAPEGINLFLAGPEAAALGLLAQLGRIDTRLADLPAKQSWSEALPFARLKVKIKREIIRMDRPAVQPAAGRAPAVDAAALARWLDAGCDDAGRPLRLLDTRNAWEVDAGRFAGAIDWRLDKFSAFPEALAAAADTLRDATVVSYCTGGIRCEKAALLGAELGLPRLLQLEGGILQYLETVGGRHWIGDCVVFDERGALDPALRPAKPAPPQPAGGATTLAG